MHICFLHSLLCYFTWMERRNNKELGRFGGDLRVSRQRCRLSPGYKVIKVFKSFKYMVSWSRDNVTAYFELLRLFFLPEMEGVSTRKSTMWSKRHFLSLVEWHLLRFTFPNVKSKHASVRVVNISELNTSKHCNYFSVWNKL